MLPWAVTFHNPDALPQPECCSRFPLHPSQLYEVFTETAL